MNTAGNIHVQLLNEMIDDKDEKTWNPDPDHLLLETPECFHQISDYWATKFVLLLKCLHLVWNSIE